MALLLNNYTQYINDFTTQQIIDEIQLQKQILIAQTERAISSKVKVASQNAANELVQLDEAIALARVLDIKQPKDYLIPLNIPLEFYGYQYLEAKKAFLERRNNSGAFIDGLTDLQEQLLNLNSLSVNSSNFRTIKIDAVASTPSDPIKPKRTLVIVLGILLGLAFGIFAAFFHSAIQSRKEKQATNPN
jgi:chain length determinant protein (polysaccharide antigen chain regulator)